MISGIYIAALAFLYILLSGGVIARRFAARVALGSGGDAILTQRMRAHGNFCEAAPIFMLLLIVLELSGGPVWLIHGAGGLFVLARLLHAYGLYKTSGPSPYRFAGMVLTFLMMLSVALYLLVTALVYSSFN